MNRLNGMIKCGGKEMNSIKNLLFAVKRVVTLLDRQKKRMLFALWVLSLLTYVVSVVTPTIEMFIADGVVGIMNNTDAAIKFWIGIGGSVVCSALGFLSRSGFENYVDMTETPLRSITNSGTWMPILAPTYSTKIFIVQTA